MSRTLVALVLVALASCGVDEHAFDAELAALSHESRSKGLDPLPDRRALPELQYVGKRRDDPFFPSGR